MLLTTSGFGEQLYRAFTNALEKTDSSFFLMAFHGSRDYTSDSLVESEAEVL
jgi:hypothetical protein